VLASLKSRLVAPFRCRLTQAVLEKRPLNGCLLSCFSGKLLCSDTGESGVSEGIVPCDTTHVKVEKTSRLTDELAAADDAGSVTRHLGMVSSSDAALPPLMSLMPSAKRAR